MMRLEVEWDEEYTDILPIYFLVFGILNIIFGIICLLILSCYIRFALDTIAFYTLILQFPGFVFGALHSFILIDCYAFKTPPYLLLIFRGLSIFPVEISYNYMMWSFMGIFNNRSFQTLFIMSSCEILAVSLCLGLGAIEDFYTSIIRIWMINNSIVAGIIGSLCIYQEIKTYRVLKDKKDVSYGQKVASLLMAIFIPPVAVIAVLIFLYVAIFIDSMENTEQFVFYGIVSALPLFGSAVLMIRPFSRILVESSQ